MRRTNGTVGRLLLVPEGGGEGVELVGDVLDGDALESGRGEGAGLKRRHWGGGAVCSCSSNTLARPAAAVEQKRKTERTLIIYCLCALQKAGATQQKGGHC